jgi:hypothetical protein
MRRRRCHCHHHATATGTRHHVMYGCCKSGPGWSCEHPAATVRCPGQILYHRCSRLNGSIRIRTSTVVPISIDQIADTGGPPAPHIHDGNRILFAAERRLRRVLSARAGSLL